MCSPSANSTIRWKAFRTKSQYSLNDARCFCSSFFSSWVISLARSCSSFSSPLLNMAELKVSTGNYSIQCSMYPGMYCLSAIFFTVMLAPTVMSWNKEGSCNSRKMGAKIMQNNSRFWMKSSVMFWWHIKKKRWWISKKTSSNLSGWNVELEARVWPQVAMRIWAR